MTKRLALLFASLMVLGFVVAGCGDDNKDKGSGSSATPADTEKKADDSGGSSGGGNAAAAKAAKDGCEAGIKNNAAIDASKQDELSKECQKVADAAASGDQGEFKKAYTSYCNKLAEALPEAARTAAKDACQQGADAIPAG
jgi:hypothetical protein